MSQPNEKERPPYGPTAHYRDPPVRDSAPAASGLVGAIGIILLVVIVVVVFGLKGAASSPSGKGGSLPKVSLAGAKPCVRSDSPQINLNSPKRLAACKKAKQYAKAKLTKKHGKSQGRKQFDCLDELWTHESAWSAWARNASSGAAGIPQALGHGKVFDTGDWKAQVDWGLNYISSRYKTPCAAWSFWQRTDARPHPGHWY